MSYVFGKNTTTGLATDYNADEIISTQFTNSGGNTTIRSLYMYGIVDGGDDARLALYHIDGALVLLEETEDLPAFTGWGGADLKSSVPVTNGGAYTLALHVGSVVRLVAFDTSVTTRDASSQTWADGAPDPFPSDENNYANREVAIYADDTWINPPAAEDSAAAMLGVL